jgi:4-hydroxythreonine-4-phosphate dehydrogenase
MLALAITMGCPAGIGPEIILKQFSRCPPDPHRPSVVIGDRQVLEFYAARLNIDCTLISWQPGKPIPSAQGTIPLYESSHLSRSSIKPGCYNTETAMAMSSAIRSAVSGIKDNYFSGLCTCPISKEALQKSGEHFPGHTEMLASLCSSTDQVMMLAGPSLRVTLATIHCAISQVPALLNTKDLLKLYHTTSRSLQIDFAIPSPRLAVAALNPHASEGGMFGTEEEDIIVPSIILGRREGLDLHGPFPPDTVFNKASQGDYDAVICMYHDQGLIPFKLLHFADGVNVTLGLPLVRTSVDHGTAYDIAGHGIADPSSLNAAIDMGHSIIANRKLQDNLHSL